MAGTLVSVVLNSVWQGLLLAFLCACVLRFTGRLSAATRYAIWIRVLIAVGLLPFAPLIDLGGPPKTSMRSVDLPIESPPPVMSQQFTPRPQAPVIDSPPPEEGSGIRLPAGDWVDAAIALWAVSAAVMLIRVVLSFIALVRLRYSAMPAGSQLEERLRRWKTALVVRRHVRVAVTRRLSSPVVAGLFRPVILFPEGLENRLSSEELDCIGLHEMAHVARRDDWSNVAQKLLEAVFVYHPAIRWIGRHLNLEREIACDDAVLTVIPGRRSYAQCLTRLAEISGAIPAVAPGARHEISRRIEMLLKSNRNTSSRSSRVVLAAASLAVVLALPASSLVPLFYVAAAGAGGPQQPATAGNEDSQDKQRRAEKARRATEERQRRLEEDRRRRAEERQRDQEERAREQEERRRVAEERRRDSGERRSHFRMSTSNFWSSFSVDLNGRIDFTPDDRDVRSLSPNGELKIEERKGLTFRRLEISADGSGSIQRAYFVNGVRREYGDEAKVWMASTLPDVIRETGIGADERVRRILKQNGYRGVLEEIERIRSDGAKRLYFEELFTAAALDRDALRETVRTAARIISSDGEKARLFMYLLEGKPADSTLQDAVISGASSISSDGEKRRVLTAVLDSRLDPVLLRDVCRVAGEISSDGEKSRLLQDIADTYGVTSQMRPAFFRAVDGISSDGEKARALLAVADRSKPDREILVHAVRSTASISSDGEKSRVLVSLAGQFSDDQALSTALVRTAESISSDGERRRALLAIIERKLNPAGFAEVARAARPISSDNEKARTLIALAAVSVPDAEFFKAADSISSDGQRREVLAAVVANKHALNRETFVRLLGTARGISSDGEKARVLVEVAEVCPADDAVITAYVETLETISSTVEFRRAFSAIARRHPGKIAPKV